MLLQAGDGLARILGRGKARALQQQAAVGGYELEIELAVGFAVLLEAGQGGLGCFGGLGGCTGLCQAAQAHGRAQRAHKRRGNLARALGARQQGLLDLLGVGHQVVIALAHGRHVAVDALKQQLLGIAPGNALGIQLAQRLGFFGRGKRLVDLEEGRALHVLGLAGRARIGQDAADQLFELIARAEQGDRVVVALAHLAAIEPWQRGHMLVNRRFGQREVLAIQVVEAGRHVARHLDVLDLVAAHGHLVGIEDQDVGTHEHGVHEEARGHSVVGLAASGGVLVLRGLVGVGTVEQALAGHAGEQPGQLGGLGDVGLAVEGDLFRVQPGGQPTGGDLQRGALDACRVFALDERVVVGQKVKALHTRAQAGRHRGADGAHKVAQVGRARGGDAGEKTRGAHGDEIS